MRGKYTKQALNAYEAVLLLRGIRQNANECVSRKHMLPSIGVGDKRNSGIDSCPCDPERQTPRLSQARLKKARKTKTFNARKAVVSSKRSSGSRDIGQKDNAVTPSRVRCRRESCWGPVNAVMCRTKPPTRTHPKNPRQFNESKVRSATARVYGTCDIMACVPPRPPPLLLHPVLPNLQTHSEPFPFLGSRSGTRTHDPIGMATGQSHHTGAHQRPLRHAKVAGHAQSPGGLHGYEATR